MSGVSEATWESEMSGRVQIPRFFGEKFKDTLKVSTSSPGDQLIQNTEIGSRFEGTPTRPNVHSLISNPPLFNIESIP